VKHTFKRLIKRCKHHKLCLLTCGRRVFGLRKYVTCNYITDNLLSSTSSRENYHNTSRRLLSETAINLQQTQLAQRDRATLSIRLTSDEW